MSAPPFSVQFSSPETHTKPIRTSWNSTFQAISDYVKQRQANLANRWYDWVCGNTLQNATVRENRFGWIGKDEVSSSNLLSSSKKHPVRLRSAGFFFFITVSGVSPKGHTPSKYRILYRIEKAGDLPPPFSFYLLFPAASKAFRKISPTRFTLSASAWVYIRKVTALSLWPSFSLTLATSAPLVIATLAKLWTYVNTLDKKVERLCWLVWSSTLPVFLICPLKRYTVLVLTWKHFATVCASWVFSYAYTSSLLASLRNIAITFWYHSTPHVNSLLFYWIDIDYLSSCLYRD